MSDALRRLKREFTGAPSVELYQRVQREQLRTRVETPWPCEGRISVAEGVVAELPGHDLVDVPVGDQLYAEAELDKLVDHPRGWVKLKVCTACGGIRKVRMVRRATDDPNDPYRQFFTNILPELETP